MKRVEPDLLFMAGPFSKIARVMSKNFRVRIVPNGLSCSTDGETIYIPFNADYLPESKRQLLNGMLDHEVCHVIEERTHKDFKRKTPIGLIQEEKNPTIRHLFNAFEDVRIERKFSLRWPGVAENLQALNKETAEDFIRSPERIGNFWHKIGCFIILTTRGYSTEWLEGPALEASKLIGEEVAASKDCLWGEDCMVLARRVYEKLKAAREEEKEEARAEVVAGEEEIHISLPGGTPMGASEGEEEGEIEDEGLDGDPSEDAEPGTADEEATIEDIIDFAAEKLEKAATLDAETKDAYIPNPELIKLDKWIKPVQDMAKFQKGKDTVQRQISVMRAKQLAYYQTISRRKVVGGLESGELEDAQLTAIRFGERNVFNESRRGRMLDTAVECLIDLSGSMGANEVPACAAYWAFRMAIALAEAWEGLRMPYEMVGFQNVGAVMPRVPLPGMVSRPAFQYSIFKGWDERLAPCRGRFAQIRGGQQNADGEAVMAAACRLATRREARRILIVISDGYPECPGISQRKNNDYLNKVVGQITRAGFEVIGVGAATNSVKQFYNSTNGASNLVINDLDTLAATVFRHLQGRMNLGAA